MEGFKAGAAFRKTKAAYFFPPEFDWFWKSCNGAQLVSSRLSDLAPTAALESILRFKLKRGGLRCYGYSVFTLSAPTKPSTNGSIVVVESLSRIGETQKAFTGPSISSGCLWNTFDRENILLHLLPSVAGIHHFHVNDDFATFIHSEDNYKRIYIPVFIIFLQCLPGEKRWCCCHQRVDCNLAAVTPPMHVPSFLKLSPSRRALRGWLAAAVPCFVTSWRKPDSNWIPGPELNWKCFLSEVWRDGWARFQNWNVSDPAAVQHCSPSFPPSPLFPFPAIISASLAVSLHSAPLSSFHHCFLLFLPFGHY